MLNKVNKTEVLDNLLSEGELTSRFAFFSIIASAIATLGLLLNSPATIIGAMLISPLMGPIVLQGLSISLIDIKLYRKSMISLLVGTFLGILTSYAIVKVSPITNITPEIVARTSPNLFDLLVAIFSGIAAAYVSIKRKGSAIVGAAIATALMIPLAVVGYGLATENFWVSKGAFFLFMTNFVAIALIVAFVSIFYGFIHYRDRRYLLLQVSLSLMILTILGIPLGISLKNIAYQTYVTTKAKNIIESHFTEHLSRLNDFSIDFQDNLINVDAVVITKTYKPEVKQNIKDELIKDLGPGIRLDLTQIALTSEIKIPEYLKNLKSKNILSNAGASTLGSVDSTTEIRNSISKQLWFPFKLISVDQNTGIITIFTQYDPSISLQNLRREEEILSKQFLDWTLRVLPSQQRIPSLVFDFNETNLSPESITTLENIVWALDRWEILEVDIWGYFSSQGNKKLNKKIALDRSGAVARFLEEEGFSVSVKVQETPLSVTGAVGNMKNRDVNNHVEIHLKSTLPTTSPS